MNERLSFWKMQGTGNHFVVFEARRSEWSRFTPAVVKNLCEHHFGIGADGVLVFDRERVEGEVPVLMRNPDGSPMGMCGNGIRCVYKRYSEGSVDKGSVLFDVEGRKITCSAKEGLIEVDMGEPSLDAAKIPVVGNPLELVVSDGECTHRGVGVSMGNPHFVIFSQNSIGLEKLRQVGPILENHPAFPNRANIEFVVIECPDIASVLVWERGAGHTLACGTAACAVVVAGVSKGVLSRRSTIRLPGGEVTVFWDQSSNHVYLLGPAEEIFRGEIELC